MRLAVEVDLDEQPLTQGVDDRQADAVQATRDLVAAATEFAARVQRGEDDLERGSLRRGMHADGDTAAVVQHGHGSVRVQGDFDGVAPAGKRLVDAVVDKLDDKVVQATQVGGADVHARSATDRLETFQNLNLVGRIRVLRDPGDALSWRVRAASVGARRGLCGLLEG